MWEYYATNVASVCVCSVMLSAFYLQRTPGVRLRICCFCLLNEFDKLLYMVVMLLVKYFNLIT